MHPTTKFAIIAAVLALSSVIILLSDLEFSFLKRIPESFQFNFHGVGSGGKAAEAAVVELAREGTWKDTLKIKEFNERQLARVDACRTGGHCPGKQSKLVGFQHFLMF